MQPMENVCYFVLRKFELAEYLVSYRLADVMYLNELATSRNEGHHRALKCNLPRGRNDMLDAVTHYLRFVRNTQMNIFNIHHFHIDKTAQKLPVIFKNVSIYLSLFSTFAYLITGGVSCTKF